MVGNLFSSFFKYKVILSRITESGKKSENNIRFIGKNNLTYLVLNWTHPSWTEGFYPHLMTGFF